MDTNTNLVRLSKLMAHRGLCSRREADELIAQGLVKVDGVVQDQLGIKFSPDVRIELSAQAKKDLSNKLSVILYKPIGYVSGPREENYPSALDLIVEENRLANSEGPRTTVARKTGMAPAGRLDVDSTGLLILTAFGPLARKLIEENSAVEKEYHVKVSGPLSEQSLETLRYGLELDGKQLKPAQVQWKIKGKVLQFILKEGRKRQIRRMCEAVGLNVIALKRVRTGPFDLSGLKPGQWRHLTQSEIQKILSSPT